MYTLMPSPEVITRVHMLKSSFLKRDVELKIHVPDQLMGNETLHLLLLNDGQESDNLKLTEALQDLYAQGKIDPVVAVSITAGEERIQEYGVAGNPDFMNRGAKAAVYTSFITEELLPFLERELTYPITGKKAIAGFSLGGLSAFDIAWNNGDLFDAAGVFSGSFWWRKKDLKDGYSDEDRIMHEVIKNTVVKPDVKFWLMTGTQDEQADRNRNFIIDSIDDTIDVIKALMAKGFQRPDDIGYYEMVGGTHHISTWAKAFPAFLCWAFARKIYS